MQRCPYLHEMKERLLSQPTPTDSLDMERLDGGTPVKEANLHNDYPAHTNPGVIPEPPEMPPDSLIGTVVKVSATIYAYQYRMSHISAYLLIRASSIFRDNLFLTKYQNTINRCVHIGKDRVDLRIYDEKEHLAVSRAVFFERSATIR